MSMSSVVTLKVLKLPNYDEAMPLPSYQTPGSVGLDVRACLTQYNDRVLSIAPGEVIAVPTGIAVEVPEGYELQVRPRSGLSLQTTLIMPNAPGTIDTDYRGETRVIFRNVGSVAETIKHGQRIAQWVLCPIPIVRLEAVTTLGQTERNDGGFGSTGTQ